MSNKLKVLHIIPSVSLARGGPSKAVIEMVSALRDNDVDAEIATTNDDAQNRLDLPLNKQTNYNGAPVIFFNRFSPTISAIREFAYSNGFRKWLNKNIHRYDIIHVHAIFSFCSSYAMYLARKKNIPYIIRPIGQLEAWSLSQSKFRKQLYLKLIEKKNIVNANSIHFTAHSEQQQSLAALQNTFANQVIPLGINIAPEIEDARQKMLSRWSLNPNVINLLFLSRLHPKKGLERLLNALSKAQGPAFQLIIAGEGDDNYKKSLINLIKRLGLNEYCHLVGFVEGNDKQLLLQGSDLFILPSYSENFGIATLEAMASAMPVIISNEVALSTEIKKYNLGWVTDLNEEELRKSIEQALTSSQRYKEIGAAAKDFANKNFNWSTQANKLKKLYSDNIN